MKTYKFALSVIVLGLFCATSFSFAGSANTKTVEPVKAADISKKGANNANKTASPNMWRTIIDTKATPVIKKPLTGITFCGNGRVEGAERCDDGNRASGDGCSFACYPEPVPRDHCGNRICETGEGAIVINGVYQNNYPTQCPGDCGRGKTVPNTTAPTYYILCGNGILETGTGDEDADEQCDDGNNNQTDGCRNCRTPYCGDGIVDPGEMCDDGNRINTDGCVGECRLARCGDGFVESGVEECDGGMFGSLTCNNRCRSLRACYVCSPTNRCIETRTTRDTCDPPFYHPTASCGGICGSDGPRPGDRELCETADLSTLPPWVMGRDYPDSRHISWCEDRGTVELMICGRSGSITFNTEVCPRFHECTNGECVLRPCHDTDPTNDLYIRGSLSGVRPNGEGLYGIDLCENSTTVSQAGCNADGTRAENIGTPCPIGELCGEGVCRRPVTPECHDTDPTNDLYIRGRLSGIRPNGEELSGIDLCENSTTVSQTGCNADRTQAEYIDTPCPIGELCGGGVCRNVNCVRESPSSSVGYVRYLRDSEYVTQPDICIGNVIQTYRCGPGDRPVEDERIACPGGCSDGLCL